MFSSFETHVEQALPPVVSDLQHEFLQAATDIRCLCERPDNDTLLRLYALYKQGLEGDVHGRNPGFFDFIGTAKKEAWSSLQGMPSADAMRQYIALVRQLLL